MTVVSSWVCVVVGKRLFPHLAIIVNGISTPLGWIIHRCFVVCRTDDDFKLVVLTRANNQVYLSYSKCRVRCTVSILPILEKLLYPSKIFSDAKP